MHCPACHKENPPGATHCEFCRTPLPDPASGLPQTVPVSGVSVGDARFEQGRLIAGRYLVERELGRGGMGVVYLVRDQRLHDKELALKLIASDLVASAQGPDRFAREVLAAQELQHPNIVRVYHLDEVAGQSFFTMEFVPGKSLREILEDRKREGRTFTLEECLSVLVPVLEALHHAHNQSSPVIHRDIKPDNIMVAGDLSAPQVKVLDFGLAKMLSPSKLTTTAMTMGTAYYMAPEQVQGARDIDQRADLFSVGVILYEMLTGQVPSGFFSMPSEVVSNLSSSVDDIIKKTLQQIPGKRYSSAQDLAMALNSLERANQKGSHPNKDVEGITGQTETPDSRQEAEKKHSQSSQSIDLENKSIFSLRPVFWAACLVIGAFSVFLLLNGRQTSVPPSAESTAAQPATSIGSFEYALTVNVEPPDASVELLGQNMTYAPGIKLATGIYDVLVHREGYVPKRFEARISDQDVFEDVRLEKEALPDPPKPQEFSLTITTDPPDAVVTFEDASMEYLPGMKLQAGTYSMLVSREGYAPQRYDARIMGEGIEGLVRLAPLFSFTLRPVPPDALVKILSIKPKYHDGIKLEAGKYDIEVSKPGYKVFRDVVHVVDKDVEVEVELEQEGVESSTVIAELPAKSSEQAHMGALPEEPPTLADKPAAIPDPLPGQNWRDPVTGMDFVWVPAGRFVMGRSDGPVEERPAHEVTLTKGFWMGRHEVTQGEWQQIMGSNPSRFRGERNPVENVSWDDAQEFISRLNGMGHGLLRLPTEAEWEFAARSGGRNERFAGGKDAERLAWFFSNSIKRTHPVGSKAANGLGLHDMSGNVSEWCEDVFVPYAALSQVDPVHASGGGMRVYRGGCWSSFLDDVSVVRRNGDSPGNRVIDRGFRLVRGQ